MPEELHHGGGGGGGGSAKVSVSAGNTAGVLTLISTGTMYLAGGNNITISQDGNSLTFSGGVNTGATTFLAGVQNLGNTSGTTGTVNNQVVFVGGNNVTLSQSINAQSATITISAYNQSVQPEGTVVFGMSNLGNTVGTSGVATGTGPRLLLVGGNNITLSQSLDAGGSSATITISGANVGGAQTGISGISASDTVYTSGTVKWTGSNMITVKSGAGQAVVIDATQSVQPLGTPALGVSSGGNTLGTTGLASGTGPRMVFVGGNNITLSQSLDAGGSSGTITISGANAGGAQTGISGVSASDTVYTSGTVKWTGSNIITVKSGTGQAVIIDATVAAQTAESQTFGMSNLGNTVGTSGVASGAQVRYLFAGGNNITLSQSINGASGTVTISAGASGAGYTAGLSNIGNTSGDATNVTGRLIFAGGNNVTLSGSTNAGSMTITISVPSGGGIGVSSGGNTAGSTGTVDYQMVFVGGSNVTLSQSTNNSSGTITINAGGGGGFQSAGISTGGNTAGTTGFASSQMMFYGGANITLSQSLGAGNASLSIIGAAGGAGFTAGDSNIGNTSGDTGAVTGRLVFAGGNNITLSGSTNAGSMTITISGPNAGGAQTGISGISASDTVYTSGTVKFTGSNNITVVSGTGQQVIISGPTGGGAGMANSGNSAGTTGTVGKELWIVGSNNITLSQSINGSSATLSIIGGAGGAGFSAGISGGNTSGDTGSVTGRLLFAGGNNITLSGSTNAGSMTISVSGPNTVAQSTQTQNLVDVTLAGNSTSAGAGYILMSSGTVTLAGGNNVTLSQNGNAVTISAANTVAQSVQTQNFVAVSGSNSLYSSGTLTITGSNMVTVKTSGAGQALIIDATQSLQTSNVHNLTLAGNSTSAGAGYIQVSSGTLTLAGGNNITLSQNGNAVTISGPNVGGAQTGISGVSASDTVYTSGTVKWTGSNMVTVKSGTGQAVIIDATQSVQTQNMVAVSASNSLYSSGTVVITGSNMITVKTSGAGQTIILDATQSVQPLGTVSFGVSSGGNTAGTTGMATGTAPRLVLFGGANVTLSQSLDAGSNSATVSIIGAAGGAAGTQTIGMSNLGNSAGTSGVATGSNVQFVFAGSNNITLSQSINGSSGTISIIGGAGGGGAAIGITNTGNTSGTNFTTSGGTVYFQGSNNITVSNSTAANVQTIWLSGPTGGGAGMGTGTNTSGTSGTVGKELYFYADAYMDLSQSVNGSSGSLTILNGLSTTGIAQNVSNVSSAGTQSSRFAMADHAHVGVGGINLSGTASTFVGQVAISVGNNLTMSTGGNSSAGTIQFFNLLSSSNQVQPISNVSNAGTNSSRFALADHAHVGISGVNLSGTASTFVGQLAISVGNLLTMSTGGNSSAGTIQFFNLLSSSNQVQPVSNVSGAGTNSSRYALADHAHVGVAGVQASGTASTFVGQLMLSGGSNISLATGGNSSAGTLAIHNVGAGTGFTTGSTTGAWSATQNSGGLSMLMPYLTRFIIPVGKNLTLLSAPGQGSASIQYAPVMHWLSGSRIDGLVSWSGSSTASAVTMGIAMSAWAAIYTRNVSTLSSLSSGSTQTTYSYASNSAGQTQLTAGVMRPISVPVNFNMPPGEYFVAFNFSTNTSSIGAATTNLAQTVSMMGGNDLQSAIPYAEFTANTATSTGLYGGMGVYTAQTAGLPAAISLSAIAQTGSSLSQANIALVFRNA